MKETSRKRGRPSNKEKKEVLSGKKDVALYIIHKYVEQNKIEWQRDMTFAYRVIRRFPEIEFWQSLLCKFKADSLKILIGKKSLILLELKYKEFKRNLEIQKDIVILPKIVYTLQDSKVGEDEIIVRTPKSIMEFIK